MPALFLCALGLLTSCGGASVPPPPSAHAAPQPDVQWEPIKSWSGTGSQYLDSFTSDTGALRIEWEATRVKNAAGGGSLRVVIHSAISGRPLTAPVIDHEGEGRGTAFVSEEPRVFFAAVTAQDVEWRIAISERVR